MRIVSLLPSATEIVFALGLGDELVGRTRACDYPHEAHEAPLVTDEADRLDESALEAARPDLILAPPSFDVGFGHDRIDALASRIDPELSVIHLEPHSIEGILNTISTIGAMADAEDEAVGLIEILRERLGAIENRVLERRLDGVAPRRVVCLEWLEPLFAAGQWVPEQVRRAGGWDLLGREGEASVETTWDAVRDVDPEQLLLMPCGLDAEATRARWARTPKPDWLDSLRAVREGEVHALDGAAYFSRPGPRVIDGVGLLAEVMDPDGFLDEAPPHGWIPLAV